MFTLGKELLHMYEEPVLQLDMDIRKGETCLLSQGSYEWGTARTVAVPLARDAAFFLVDILPQQEVCLQECPGTCLCASVMSEASASMLPQAPAQPLCKQRNVGVFAMDCPRETYTMQKDTHYLSYTFCWLPSYLERMSTFAGGSYGQLFERTSPQYQNDLPRELAQLLLNLDVGQIEAPGMMPYFQGIGLHALSLLNSSVQSHYDAHQRFGSREQQVVVAQAKALMQQNLSASIHLEDVAHDVYVSRSYLCAAFKAETGYSVLDWLRRERMVRAQELLLQPKVPIRVIAEQVGFKHLSSFSQCFKAQVGCSPRAWRAQL
ncbi:helix-turn-helix transcriptional regulator [Collinsella sp. zg1085]|uniref:helix-turn-helix transcriptional regulator n=1 Tax=Collinsella sp. zg1085 TaxID=2844380 RepID=UPI001C0AC02C|nr:helix-turn-helix transcriptional regulator [Collinsella sp. zg1085]QWT17842.1 helix-turn-helix transcriptional regulator [Collinsella sp. zg1085]